MLYVPLRLHRLCTMDRHGMSEMKRLRNIISLLLLLHYYYTRLYLVYVNLCIYYACTLYVSLPPSVLVLLGIILIPFCHLYLCLSSFSRSFAIHVFNVWRKTNHAKKPYTIVPCLYSLFMSSSSSIISLEAYVGLLRIGIAR